MGEVWDTSLSHQTRPYFSSSSFQSTSSRELRPLYRWLEWCLAWTVTNLVLLVLSWSTSLVEYLILGSSFVNKVLLLSRFVFKDFCHEPHCSFLVGNGWIACQDKWRRERDSRLSWSRLRSQFETRIMTAATHSQLYLIYFEGERDRWLSYKASFLSIWNPYYDSSQLIHSCIWNILQIDR